MRGSSPGKWDKLQSWAWSPETQGTLDDGLNKTRAKEHDSKVCGVSRAVNGGTWSRRKQISEQPGVGFFSVWRSDLGRLREVCE